MVQNQASMCNLHIPAGDLLLYRTTYHLLFTTSIVNSRYFCVSAFHTDLPRPFGQLLSQMPISNPSVSGSMRAADLGISFCPSSYDPLSKHYFCRTFSAPEPGKMAKTGNLSLTIPSQNTTYSHYSSHYL